jgi:hypothetical protein
VLFNAAISNLVSNILMGRWITLKSPLKVLFRNNFALSRDITGLFQSFQSSSTVLDPSANPSLFQSTLVIIIKVRDCSQREVYYLKLAIGCRRIGHKGNHERVCPSIHHKILTFASDPKSRFQLKFQRIVEDEQDANFISRLHGGHLCIIPWCLEFTAH